MSAAGRPRQVATTATTASSSSRSAPACSGSSSSCSSNGSSTASISTPATTPARWLGSTARMPSSSFPLDPGERPGAVHLQRHPAIRHSTRGGAYFFVPEHHGTAHDRHAASSTRLRRPPRRPAAGARAREFRQPDVVRLTAQSRLAISMTLDTALPAPMNGFVGDAAEGLLRPHAHRVQVVSRAELAHCRQLAQRLLRFAQASSLLRAGRGYDPARVRLPLLQS